MSEIDISIIIPLYNEEKNIFLLYSRIKDSMKSLTHSYEIIFVDDGSRDLSWDKIKQLCNSNSDVKGVSFLKNFKKSAAYMAGFEKAKGKIIITMDGDLQDEPAEISRLLDGLKKYDLIIGWKYPRRDGFLRRLPSKIFNFLNVQLFGIKLHDFDCGFRAMKSNIAKELNLYGDIYRYIPALVYRLGYKVGEVKIRHNKRKYGKSRYGWSRLITGFLDLITVKFISDFQQRPLHLFGSAGMIFFGVGFLAELYVLYRRVFLNELFATHLPMLILGVLLIIMGIQLLSIGLIGELITSSKKVPRYRIKKILN
ncbi:glycosyltransferase family 2 protein [Bacteroidota bacterium]